MLLSLIYIYSLIRENNVKKVFSIVLFVFFLICLSAKAEIKFYKAGVINANLGFEYSNSSSYYDYSGTQVTEFPDTLNSIPKHYMFKQRSYELTFNAEAYINDNWAVYATVPYAIRTYSETYIADTNSAKFQKCSYNLSKVSYYMLGTKAFVQLKNFSSEIFADVSLPTGSHNGVRDDNTYDFYYDGDFEFNLGTALQYDFEKSWVGAAFIYNNRSEDLSDQFKLNLELGLRTVPGTSLKVFSNMIFSINKINETIKFDPRKIPLQDNNVKLGAAFNIIFSKDFYSELSYKVDVLGKNTFVNSAISLNFGLLINNVKK